ncbi:uncharacterized protein LOC106023765 isoform X4 [Esox lucius]|uniref:uncharacterized protein LOC106023765 isoform X4 n=1 Tax=Esox lucius TaxID=8010 RepID=UPI0014777A1E|nr:uncharacterized protein LOC106023765 isoform X4 [Esox lucius]
MLQEMVEVHQAFKDLDETTDITDRKFKIITEYVSNYYADALGRQWLQKENNQKRFANEIQLFRNYFKNFLKEKERREDESSRERSKRRYRKRKLDIVFIAHGSITDDSIPASELISPSVDDLVLYSPWNCSITAQVAYGIASGKIQPPDRLFINMVNNHDVAAAEALLPPSLLPPHWNSMSSAGGALIPWVWVSPAVDDEPVDQCLMYFIQEGGVDRLVIRYIVPSWLRSVFVPVPLFVVMYALSFMLSVAGYTAKVHLAACLPYQSPINSEPWRRKRQYACTYDRVAMTNRNIDAHLRNHIRSAYEKVFEFPSREADYRH